MSTCCGVVIAWLFVSVFITPEAKLSVQSAAEGAETRHSGIELYLAHDL